ncbi:MAG: metallophosphoesterase [Planctomycetia bacterium]
MQRARLAVSQGLVWVIVSLMATAAEAQFRVNPYLQQPSSTGVLVNWFTIAGTAGQISVTGPGLGSPIVLSSSATLQTMLDYTPANLTQTISGLSAGSWIVRNPDDTPARNYKHSAAISGLQPDSEYTYTVQQGSETFSRSFRTAPTANAWNSIRFIAMSDSETEPAGQVTRREWQNGALAAGSVARPATVGSAWASTFGTISSGGASVLRYSLTETVGYAENLKVVDARNPAFILMPGDLVQGGGYQPGWDSFFEHTAGFRDDVLSKRAILPALGNWENFAASDGGYDPVAVVRSRHHYKAYFDSPGNGTPQHQDNYYRQDFGPITVITLDSSNGSPDDNTTNYAAGVKLTGTHYTVPGTDTQNNFTVAQYQAAYNTVFGTTAHDLSDFNPGSVQWNWAKAQLEDARANGQIIFVQFHHAPYSDGEHGLPMNHADSFGQGGTPLRTYHPLFEANGVVAVFSGHSELFERSFVDGDANGVGVHYYDVGISGDGLRGERRTSAGFTSSNLLNYNSFSQWTADQSEGELWETLGNGVTRLADGGKHYGHLEVDLQRVTSGSLFDLGVAATVTLTPVYVFPVLDENLAFVSTERRVYGDTQTLLLTASGIVVPEPVNLALVAALGGSAIAVAARRRSRAGRADRSPPPPGP